MEKLLKESFGLDVRISSISPPGNLPLYLVADREFFFAVLPNVSFVIVALGDPEKFRPSALYDQVDVYRRAFDMPIAFSFSFIDKRQRNTLVSKHIPFIAPPSQIYLPFLALSLADHFPAPKNVSTDKMTASSQMLFLYFLYMVKDQAVIKIQAANDLKMTKMSVTRASQQLLGMNLITQRSVGREQQMKAVNCGGDYFRSAIKYLISPVQRTFITEMSEKIHSLPDAGETALSNHSMLGGPAIPDKAIYKGNDLLSALQPLDEKWDSDKELVRIECWKYDPVLFSSEGSVDPVSLFASLRENPDERIQGELNDYIKHWSSSDLYLS